MSSLAFHALNTNKFIEEVLGIEVCIKLLSVVCTMLSVKPNVCIIANAFVQPKIIVYWVNIIGLLLHFKVHKTGSVRHAFDYICGGRTEIYLNYSS